MNKTNCEIRAEARDNLRGGWGGPILAFFLFTLISSLLQLIPVVGYILTLIISGPMLVGLTTYFLKLARNESKSIENIFDGFKNCFATSLVATILISIFTTLWSLLLFIPGIIKSLSYSQTFFILSDHPEMSSTEAIKLSQKIMDGHKMQLFLLNLSFIGWAILSMFTLCIGYLWLCPYIQTSLANFYEDIRNDKETFNY